MIHINVRVVAMFPPPLGRLTMGPSQIGNAFRWRTGLPRSSHVLVSRSSVSPKHQTYFNLRLGVRTGAKIRGQRVNVDYGNMLLKRGGCGVSLYP